MTEKIKKKDSVKKKPKKEQEKKEKSVFHKKSDAGKGDVPRTGLSPGEWTKKWESIFGKKKLKKDKKNAR
jgi:hypothetical protein